MQYNNIRHGNFFNPQNTEELVYSIDSALKSIGYEIIYYAYNSDANDYNFPINIYAQIEDSSDTNLEVINADKVITFVTLSKYFIDKNLVPSKKDKLIYKDNTYYVGDIEYSNSFNNGQFVLNTSMVVKIRAIKKDKLSASEF